MAPALIEELKIVATEAKRSQIEDTVGSSWAALTAEEDPQGREIGTLLLVEAGAGGGKGRERGGGERAGRGWGGVLDSENNGRIRWQPSLIGRLSRARPTEGLEECAWELYLAFNQTSRAPSMHTVGRSSCKISKPKKNR